MVYSNDINGSGCCHSKRIGSSSDAVRRLASRDEEKTQTAIKRGNQERLHITESRHEGRHIFGDCGLIKRFKAREKASDGERRHDTNARTRSVLVKKIEGHHRTARVKHSPCHGHPPCDPYQTLFRYLSVLVKVHRKETRTIHLAIL